MKITSKQQLKAYCENKLGQEFHQLNISEQNKENAIQDSLDFMYLYNADFLERSLLSIQVSQTNINNKFIILPNDVHSVNKIFPINRYTFQAFNNTFLLNSSFFTGNNSTTNITVVDYEINRTYLSLIDSRLSSSTDMRFNRLTKKLQIDFEWGKDIALNEYIIADVYTELDPEVYTNVYSDINLRNLVTATLKNQWAMNLSKFANVQTVGGVYLNVDEIRKQSETELTEIKELIMSKYTHFVPFLVG